MALTWDQWRVILEQTTQLLQPRWRVVAVGLWMVAFDCAWWHLVEGLLFLAPV